MKYLYVQDLVKTREIEVSRVATVTNLGDIGYETFAEPQTGIPQEFGGEELRERDDVPSRVWKINMTNWTRIQMTVSTDDVDRDQEITL